MCTSGKFFWCGGTARDPHHGGGDILYSGYAKISDVCTAYTPVLAAVVTFFTVLFCPNFLSLLEFVSLGHVFNDAVLTSLHLGRQNIG